MRIAVTLGNGLKDGISSYNTVKFHKERIKCSSWISLNTCVQSVAFSLFHRQAGAQAFVIAGGMVFDQKLRGGMRGFFASSANILPSLCGKLAFSSFIPISPEGKTLSFTGIARAC